MTAHLFQQSHNFIILASILYTFSDAITQADIDAKQLTEPLSMHEILSSSPSATTIAKHLTMAATAASATTTATSTTMNITPDAVSTTTGHRLINLLSTSSIRPSVTPSPLPLLSSIAFTGPKKPQRSSSIISSSSSMSKTAAIASQATDAQEQSNHDVLYIGPYLDDTEITNITVQIGTNAYLPCKVKQLGNKSVSWVRVRDSMILSVDRMTFIADERFQAHYKEDSKQWVLQIKYVQPRDIGEYECQVSTEPKISARAYLHVVVPRTELIGNSDRYVKTGSTVYLQCNIYGAIEPTTYIMWYHDAQPILTDNKLGYKMQMIKGGAAQNNVADDAIKHDINNNLLLSPFDGFNERQHSVGSLIIDSARKSHSGNYTCHPSNSSPSTVTLHVISSESSASPVKSSASIKHLFASQVYAFNLIRLIIFMAPLTFWYNIVA